MEQLSVRDTNLLQAGAPYGNFCSTGVFIYDPSTAPGGVVDIDSIVKHIEGRLSTSDIFYKKVVEVPLDLDCPYWINDEHFELENHIRHVALPKPGDWGQLCTLTARIHSHPLDMSRPLWEMYVIEGLDQIEWLPEGCFAIISKLHHAAIGERSGDEIMGGLLNRSSDSTPLVPGYLPIPESKPDLATMLFKTSLNLLTSPIKTTTRPVRRALSYMIPEAVKFYPKLFTGPRDPVRTRFNNEISGRKVWNGCSFPLEEIRILRSLVPDATVHDVVLSLVGGALINYLRPKGEIPRKEMSALVPFIRKRHPKMKDSPNAMSFKFIGLSTNIEDPVERLANISAQTSEYAKKIGATGAKELSDYGANAPTEILAHASRLMSAYLNSHNPAVPNVHCSVTNVPGPQEPLYFSESKMVAMFGLAPLTDGMGLALIINSYNGRVFVSITSCSEMMPDSSTFTKCMSDSFEQLRAVRRGDHCTKSLSDALLPSVFPAKDASLSVEADDGEAKSPALINTLMEPRAWLEGIGLPLGLPALWNMARGDGHPVMVLPGFSGDDATTIFLRKFLESKGYAVIPWGFKRNLGLAGNVEERVAKRVESIHRLSGRKVSLIGHSMGGVISRQVGHLSPDSIRLIITMGSPHKISGDLHDMATHVVKMFGGMAGDFQEQLNTKRLKSWRKMPPVPLTSIYSRSDLCAHRDAFMVPEDHAQCESVQVHGSHSGMALNLFVYDVIANRLAQPEGEWKPFKNKGFHSLCNTLLKPLQGVI